TVLFRNLPPVANDDFGQMGEYDEDISISVLSNDTDEDGSLDQSSLQVVVPPQSGEATVTGQQITYRPEETFQGTDTFTYTICDNYDPPACSTAVVTVVV